MNAKQILMMILIHLTVLLNAQNPVIIPDTLSGTSFDLFLQNGSHQFFAGQTTTTMGVNGNILGPTLIMNKNDNVNIEVTNQLNDTTTIHWHGMHVSSENDGGPHTYILPGETWNPSFEVMDFAGTYWYHPHLHMKTNEHVLKGIAGFIIVRDQEEAMLDLPRTYGVDDFPLVIQTKDFNANNQIIIPSNSDDVLMVNATINPALDVPAQVVRLRLLNGSSSRVFNIGLSGNQSFYQIGSDGGLLNTPNYLTRLQMAPGERAELLIDFSGMQGQTLNLMSYASELQNGIYGATNPGMMSMMTLDDYYPNYMNGANFDIIQLNVTAQTSNPVTSIPTSLGNVNPIPEDSADLTRNLLFTPETMGMNQLNGNFLINSVSFNMEIINYTIPLDNIEIWSITNQSATAHPFHIHDVQFFVLDRNGFPPQPSEQGRKDVILIKPMETVRFITKFNDFANSDIPYMYHCHMLVHEDGGMMGQFVVIDNNTAIQDNKKNIDNLIVYPNPVKDKYLHIESDNEISSYEIHSLTGKKLIIQIIENSEKNIKVDVSDLPSGIYILKITVNGRIHSEKLIKN